MGMNVEIDAQPQRIISLVPSQTELLYDLGLEERVVGITKFCIHPGHWHKSKTVIGGTKKFDLEAIRAVQPDLIIGNKEENYAEGISELRKQFPVWMSDITTLDQALEMINEVSRLTSTESRGKEIVQNIRDQFRQLHRFPEIRTLYLMWRKPWMGAAANTFIHDMVEKTGLVNVLGDQERYPELSLKVIRRLNPSLVLLSSEPFPFSERHIPELTTLLPDAVIRLVNGEMFSWYGSRLTLAPTYFRSLKIGV